MPTQPWRRAGPPAATPLVTEWWEPGHRVGEGVGEGEGGRGWINVLQRV